MLLYKYKKIVDNNKQTNSSSSSLLCSSTEEKLFSAFNGMDNCDILKDWIYRGEGNSNIVISIPNTRQILRIKKTDKRKSYFEHCVESLMQYLEIESCDEYFDKKILTKSITHKFKNILGNILDWCFHIFDIEYNNTIHNAELSLQFYKRIMMPLLGETFTSCTKSIVLSKREITILERGINKLRPDFRKSKRLYYGKATLFADYAFLPKHMEESFTTYNDTYAIEIKPKLGWIPLSKQNNKKCQFCQNQYLKLEKKQIQTISKYCPLNLFSGDKTRMLHAITSLITNPQNNFRLFCNGNYIYGEMMSQDVFFNALKQIFDSQDSITSLYDEFCLLLIKALTEPLGYDGCDHVCTLIKSLNADNEDSKCAEVDCVSNSTKLTNGCVLEKILSIQKFDQLGLKHYDKSTKEYNKGEWNYVEKLLEVLDKRRQCPRCVITHYVNEIIDNYNNNNNNLNNKIHTKSVLYLIPYLVASVAGDCSLMITFKKIKSNTTSSSSPSTKTENNYFVLNTKYGNYIMNIGVFDLYPKPLSTISKHVLRDLKLSIIT